MLHATPGNWDEPLGGDVTGDFVPFGGTNSRLYERLSLLPAHHSHDRTTVDQGVQVGAPAPLVGIVYFFISEEGSDVQQQVIVQEIPDVAAGLDFCVQQQVIVQEIPDVAAGLDFCVHKHVIVQEIPDVAVGMVASVQQQVIVQQIPDVAAGLEFCVQEQMIVQEIPDVAVERLHANARSSCFGKG